MTAPDRPVEAALDACPECDGHGTRVRRDGLAVRCVECAEVEG